MGRRKYLFFDIDGTLVAGGYGNSYIPDSAKVALEKLREAGHFLAIATGRSQAMAADYMQNLSLKPYMLDGAKELLSALKGKVKMYIVTNGVEFIQKSRYSLSGLSLYFDGIFISDKLTQWQNACSPIDVMLSGRVALARL